MEAEIGEKMKYIIIFGVGLLIGIVIDRINCRKITLKVRNSYEKFHAYFEITDRWLNIVEGGKRVESYFQKKGFQTIAIYGMGVLGMRLVGQLELSNINVKYAIDNKASKMRFDIPIKGVDDEFDNVDVIVVTAIMEFESIKEKLSKKTNNRIISLEDIIYEL